MALNSSFKNPADHQVLLAGNSNVKTIILNKPEKLNALAYPMIFRLLRTFAAYKKDHNIKLVILKANGKAFCAGGDVLSIGSLCTLGHWTFGITNFRNTLNLVYTLATFPKPMVSLMDGIVMGAGVGISIFGTFRVVTEKTVFAMPESSLGYHPDVGASFFLSRIPHFIGEYIGLTGARLDGIEMLACGLATHFVISENLPLLEKALYGVDSSDEATISEIINRFSGKSSLRQGSPILSLDTISKCFSKETVEEILLALEQEAVGGADEWIHKAIKSMKLAAPTSLKVFLKSIRAGRTQNLNQCLIREFRITTHVFRRTVNGDYFEGCRALLIDKDKCPKWEPSKLELVTPAMVDQYFEPVQGEDWEDLQLPPVSIGVGVAKL